MTDENRKEALRHINAQLEYGYLDLGINDRDELKIIKEALEKQIPKKPIIWENRYYFSPIPNDDWGYECPCCGNQEIDYPEHHCDCGQALDWTEENV
jgi:hypothetical protein